MDRIAWQNPKRERSRAVTARTKSKRTSFQANQEEFKLRCAWLYYVEGMTQEQVAHNLGISRLKVLRLLAATRDEGTVQVIINSQAQSFLALQRALEKHLGLYEAVVVPASDQGEATIASVVGYAAARFLSDQVSDGLSVGIGWGGSLQACMRALTWREAEGLTVVSLLGGLTRASAYNPSSVAWRLADFYQSELYQITAPVFVPDEGLAEALWAQEDFRQLRERARSVDIALLSVGDVSTQASIFRRGILQPEDGKSLRDAGAVGDVLCHFVDQTGVVIDHPVNRRVMAIDPTVLRQVPKVVIASGGVRKVQAIRAGLLATGARMLITDVAAANALLELPPVERTRS
ncbi:sugar-binding transcriptional regulator [Pseudohoeflea coraliihabitans]|uniref:Sugar-binding transcriptional regulator n=1 Tax=Pseudohoeflea coraliihabitans TaxID=2860393 RepID=A0ABS6WMJ6_9HYPH|nr:sugar-binding transcriptional regulator [Pseudohoeflea sp. DP4N28-3]MBW3097178.1 sugar-binding transcriptional regulator [Pseudohoeflea sp. DP4N28-3]